MHDKCPLGHDTIVVAGIRRCVECTRSRTRTVQDARKDVQQPVRASGTLSVELDSVKAAIERRDASEARQMGISVSELHMRREAAQREAENARLEEEREERLGADRRRVTGDDAALIVSADETRLAASKPWRIVDRWLRSGRPFCVLSGPRGVGKTVAAMAAKARLGGLVIGPDDMVRAHRNEHERALALRERIFDVGLLVLDDLGLEVDGESAVRAFQALIDQRQGGGRRTLVTTNLKRAQIESTYDARTIERITHGGAFVELTGTSMRRVS